MKKYAVVIDYKASYKSGFDLYLLDAKNPVEAMNEAEKYLTDNVYLISVAEKSGKIEREGSLKMTKYTEILTNRHSGWHAADDDHCETAATWRMTEDSKYDWTSWDLMVCGK